MMLLQNPTREIRRPAAAQRRSFDGVICFGGCDWWYHNRAHYDLQMMRHFSRIVPVVYVNSIGIRVPKMGEGSMFYRRVWRKVKSWSRGFVKVNDTFAVLSPLVIPGRRGMAISRRLLVPQIKLAAGRMGIRRPLVWVNTPTGIHVVDELSPAGVIYERTDRWEAFPEADAEEMLLCDRLAKARADLSLYCARLLIDEESAQCRQAIYVDHGVDFERFAAAGAEAAEPEDVKQYPRPRVGLVGAIDGHKIDIPLMTEVARRLPGVEFLLVGPCSLPDVFADLPNVHLLGQRPYEQVPAYMAACDVLMMPWNQNEWIKACNPVKLKEYLAVGRPVVSTEFEELKNYRAFVRIAHSAEDFAENIRSALANGCDVEAMRRRVRRETWKAKHEMVMTRLAELGLEPLERRPHVAAGFDA